MPITYALNMFGLSFATLSSLLVWVLLENRTDITAGARRIPQVMRNYFSKTKSREDDTGHRDVPVTWYLVAAVVALFLCIFSVEYWHAELRWYGVLLACAVALVFYGPVGSSSNTIGTSAHLTPSARHCVRNLQLENQHRHLLPDCRRVRLRGQSSCQYLVLRHRLHHHHQGPLLRRRHETVQLLQCPSPHPSTHTF